VQPLAHVQAIDSYLEVDLAKPCRDCSRKSSLAAGRA
jgi:hypothetical protein